MSNWIKNIGKKDLTYNDTLTLKDIKVRKELLKILTPKIKKLVNDLELIWHDAHAVMAIVGKFVTYNTTHLVAWTNTHTSDRRMVGSMCVDLYKMLDRDGVTPAERCAIIDAIMYNLLSTPVIAIKVHNNNMYVWCRDVDRLKLYKNSNYDDVRILHLAKNMYLNEEDIVYVHHVYPDKVRVMFVRGDMVPGNTTLEIGYTTEVITSVSGYLPYTVALESGYLEISRRMEDLVGHVHA